MADESEPLLRNVSDTARWAALWRARETERPDALFQDRFARRLAGERGERIARGMPDGERNAWAWTTRTCLFDRLIREQLVAGIDTVLNLAAGLDARPYRMDLPTGLRWFEVDLPELFDYKDEVLERESPRCTLERFRLDLADRTARQALFDDVGRRAGKALILTEGLLIYPTAEQVGGLAEDLARPASFQRWICEVLSPGLLQIMQRQWERQLTEARAPFQFAPTEGPGFFQPFGWQPLEVHSMLKTAARLRRLSLWMRFLALLPESNGVQGKRPWSGICLLGKR
jgi:methyltransferase (TIGR00027 family)